MEKTQPELVVVSINTLIPRTSVYLSLILNLVLNSGDTMLWIKGSPLLSSKSRAGRYFIFSDLFSMSYSPSPVFTSVTQDGTNIAITLKMKLSLNFDSLLRAYIHLYHCQG